MMQRTLNREPREPHQIKIWSEFHSSLTEQVSRLPVLIKMRDQVRLRGQ